MHLVTTRRTTASIDPETKVAVPVTVTEAHVETEGVDDLLSLKAAGDDRVATARVFELTVADDGTPSIGAEL